MNHDEFERHVLMARGPDDEFREYAFTGRLLACTNDSDEVSVFVAATGRFVVYNDRAQLLGCYASLDDLAADGCPATLLYDARVAIGEPRLIEVDEL